MLTIQAERERWQDQIHRHVNVSFHPLYFDKLLAELETAEKREAAALAWIRQLALPALEPFANDAKGIDPSWDSRRNRDTLTGIEFTIGDCRRAAEALAALPPGLRDLPPDALAEREGSV